MWGRLHGEGFLAWFLNGPSTSPDSSQNFPSCPLGISLIPLISIDSSAGKLCAPRRVASPQFLRAHRFFPLESYVAVPTVDDCASRRSVGLLCVSPLPPASPAAFPRKSPIPTLCPAAFPRICSLRECAFLSRSSSCRPTDGRR